MPAFLPILRGVAAAVCGLMLLAVARGQTRAPSPGPKDLIEQVRKAPVEDLTVINSAAVADLYGETRALASMRAAGGGFRSGAEKKGERPPHEMLPGQKAVWAEWGLGARLQKNPLADEKAAEQMQEAAFRLRRAELVTLPGRNGVPTASKITGANDARLVEDALQVKGAAGVAEAQLPTLMQMLQAEGEAAREVLVTLLAGRPCAYSSAALTRLAVFDLSPKVRTAATEALKARPKEEYRKVLLEGLRYPWPAPAQHAAEALVALEDRAAVPELRALAELPTPTLPFAAPEGQGMLVREVIAVNHLRNCLLCHAPAAAGAETLTAPVPEPGQPLPTTYYGRDVGRSRGALVRADVTYLRQDFSVMLPVENAKPWPEVQRFDFLVRTRPATKAEVEGIEEQRKAPYPQREAVLFAIKRLSAPGAVSKLPD